jgi:hypothetical protein
VEKILHLMKKRPGVLLKNQTSGSKQNPFPTALEQRHAKTRFQISHLLRNTRLRNSEPVSRPAKASRLGDREKIPEMANVQRFRHGRRNIVRRTCEMQSGA